MTLPRYPEYNESKFGWLSDVPAHWEVKRLKTISPFITVGVVINPSDYVSEDGLPFIYGGDISEGRISVDSCRKISPENSQKQAKTVLEAGDLLTVRVGAPGVTAVVPESCAGGNCASVMLVRKGRFDSRWLCYAMNSRMVRYQVEVVQYGAAQEQFNISHAINFWIATPPHPEQIEIAAFLDKETGKIDALISEQEKLLTLLAEKRQATVSHAVIHGLDPDAPMKDSGVVWLGEVPAHWEVVGLTKYLESVVDYRGRTPTKVDAGVFLVTAKNIRDGVIDYQASEEYIEAAEYDEVMRRGLPLKGDVLFTTEAPLGQVAIVDREDIALAQRIIKFRAVPERLDGDYLKAWIMGSACQFNLEQLATGSTALGIKGSKVGQVRLCLPPLDEQHEIVRHINTEISKLDILKVEVDRAISLLKERRSALITAAVTGKIDVRGAVAPPANKGEELAA